MRHVWTDCMSNALSWCLYSLVVLFACVCGFRRASAVLAADAAADDSRHCDRCLILCL